MKKTFICVFILSLLSPWPLQASKKNDSFAVVGGVSSIALMTAACAHGKMDQQGVALVASSIVALGVGHHFATEQGLYTIAVTTLGAMSCFFGFMLGIPQRIK